MVEVAFKVVEYGSDLYNDSVRLREDVLRKPFGLCFSKKELEAEKDYINIAGFSDNILCVTAVLVPDNGRVKMQRVAVKSDLQNHGIGAKLLDYCELYAKKKNYSEIYAHARDTAVKFYCKYGYKVSGDFFDEDGIPHQLVKKLL